ncbi:YdiU family protein [Ramlibacter sp. H39-3-26]|uniref:protein adenylyltransferase SelO n=1 Tax=Curvibacter soli TaxID=3031331 RepID=UPI0023D9CAA7|nr:YdiU family protein [Ramlibacter sp. H39-3-26]MDF1485376.1 YdiU family protein [Ramlibacter sp. H39-3-26]
MDTAATIDRPADTALPFASGLAWRNGFAALGPRFSTALRPTPLPAPYWVGTSPQVAALLGLPAGWQDAPGALDAFTGSRSIAGAAPLASVYSGHQFGVWAGQLGDGRAILLGETSGGWEVQLKGSGRTPYSRMGDGRAVLRSSIREFLASEAMHALGIPTTRALCVTGSDAPVRREEVETAAVVARVAPSFIRFGHFEHFAATGRVDELRTLADYVIDRYYPACRSGGRFAGNAYAALLEAVGERTAALVAQWQAVGFCHGVMNTDNMSILGLTIDYGPFQFMDGFDPGHICNHSDTQGRYAFSQQPQVAYWNLFCLAQALLPLVGEEETALAALAAYRSAFPAAFEARMRAKLGLADEARPGDGALADATLRLLAGERTDYTIFWRRLSRHVAGAPVEDVRDLFLDRAAFDTWMLSYQERLSQVDKALAADLMCKTNPKFVLRNHLGEQAIRSAREHRDFGELQTLQRLLATPYDEHPGHDAHAGFPPDWASSIEISCSS